jgi:branched-subunit amino acid transport protein
MMPVQEVLLILGMTLVTFGVRYVPLALVGRFRLPGALLDALKYVPPAVLTAIIVPSVFMPDGERFQLGIDNAYWVAALAAAVVAAWSKRTALTVAVGMAALWLWQWLLRAA